MAKNIKSLQLLRNGKLFDSYAAAVAGITGTPTDDGVIKLARYTYTPHAEGSGDTKYVTATAKTIFGICHNPNNVTEGTTGYTYTIFDSYHEVIENLQSQINDITGGGEGSIAEQIKTAIEKLDCELQRDDNKVVVSLKEVDGIISGSTADNLTSVKLGGYSLGTDADIAATDTLGEALGKLQAQINAMDKAASSGEGEVVITVVEGDGKVTEQKEKISKVLLNDYVKDTTGTTKADKVAATDSLGTALSKLENQIEVVSANTDDIVSNLTANTVANENKVITDVTQSNGKITATASNLTGVKLAEYTVGNDNSGKVAATDTLGEALGKLQGQINGMDKAASAVDGQVVTTVTQADGKVTETKANVKDLQLGGYTKNASATGDIASTDTINEAISKLENKAAAITIANADSSINVTTGATGTDINVNIKEGEHVLAKGGNAGLYTNIAISAITGADLTALGTNVKEAYKLVGTDGAKLGTEIKIYKDSSISKIYLGFPYDSVDANTGVITSGTTGEAQSLNYVYHKEDGTYEMVHVDVSKFLAESEFKSGVTADNTGVVHGVVDADSEKNESNVDFLTVGADGFKVSGIKDAIGTKINKLNYTDTALAGQYVTEVDETNGVIAVQRANVSEAVLNNYAKGAAPAAANSAITATDTINTALAKLEHQVDAAKAAATTKVAEGTDAGNNMTIVPTTSTTDGSVTYTVNLTDVAKASAVGLNNDGSHKTTSGKYTSGANTITDEIAALDNALDTVSGKVDNAQAEIDKIETAVGLKEDGTYSANTTNNYTSAATSVNDAIDKLDAAAKSLAEGKLSGVTVNGKSLTVTHNVATQTVSGRTSEATAINNEAIVVETDNNGNLTLGIAILDAGFYD